MHNADMHMGWAYEIDRCKRQERYLTGCITVSSCENAKYEIDSLNVQVLRVKHDASFIWAFDYNFTDYNFRTILNFKRTIEIRPFGHTLC